MKVIHVLRKPCLEPTVAANVLRYGTGALNIDATRIKCAPGDEVSLHGRNATENGWDARWSNAQDAGQTAGQALGRWPANLVLQHLDGCVQDRTETIAAWTCALGTCRRGSEAVKVVHVLRKPCSEPTVAANVLRWGTGAINVDATRIGTNAGWAYPNGRGGSGWHGVEGLGRNLTQPMASTAGRWPANLVLQHLDGCVQDGTRRVKASGFDQSSPPRSTGLVFGEHRDTPKIRHSDPDGTETIAAWTCAPGCPVAALDQQSGGASRFFHQSRTPPYDYFRKLISPDHLPDVVYLHVTAPDTLAKENDAAVHAMTVLAASTDTHWIPHALRVLKPGGHLLLAAPDAEPTNDTLVCAAEDAGFEVRDCIFLADSADDRLHYVAKAGKKEREAGLGAGEARKNTHPTVKPIAVMRRLLAGVRRDLPVLDPFVGSGTTLLACVAEGCDGIGIEREGEYFAIATARVDARVSGMLATRTDGEARVEWVEEG